MTTRRALGIELVPAIQSAGASGPGLQIWAAFSDVVDCNDILRRLREKTYALIDATVPHTGREPWTSRKVNIGMDEGLK